MRVRRRLCLGGLMAAAGRNAMPSRAMAQALAGRTFYDALRLHSPAAATETFIGLYDKGDFLTLFYVLSPSTQRQVAFQFTVLALNGLLRLPQGQSSLAEPLISALLPREGMWEHEDPAWIFNQIMQAAREHDVLPLAWDKGSLVGPAVFKSETAATVQYGAPGAEPVEFQLALSPAGRWRVSGVYAPGTNKHAPPWGLRP